MAALLYFMKRYYRRELSCSGIFITYVTEQLAQSGSNQPSGALLRPSQLRSARSIQLTLSASPDGAGSLQLRRNRASSFEIIPEFCD